MATKTTTKKTETKTSAAKAVKEETAKATAARKTTTKKTAAKKTATARTAAKKINHENTEVYIQFWGKEVYAKEVVENIHKIWTDEMGKKEADLKDLKVYIKPEENGAHYVINGEIRGFIGL